MRCSACAPSKGARRQAGELAASGDIVFASAHGLGRFTSALAHEVHLNAPAGEFTGDALTMPSGSFVVAGRPDRRPHYTLQSWNAKAGSFEALLATNDADLVEPALIEARPIPNQHPSGLHQTGDLRGKSNLAKRRRLVSGRIFNILLLSAAMLAQTQPSSTIRFEDATAASGTEFTHSFGSQKLGSLLEGTGGGCVWFDYNNDGKPDLYVTSGRWLEDASAEAEARGSAPQPSVPQ